MGATYCPRVQKRVSRPGGGGSDICNVIDNFEEGLACLMIRLRSRLAIQGQ